MRWQPPVIAKRDAVADREQHDQRDVVADRGGRRMRLERVDRSLHRPGDCQRRERRGGETDDAEGVAGPVVPDVTPRRPRGRGQPRLPAACGWSAA